MATGQGKISVRKRCINACGNLTTMSNDGFHKETNKCISTAQGRVIIIGPDVDGYDGNIGEYAQTEPDADQLPSTFVNVKFARTRTDGRQIEQRHGRYHLHSLCRATNAPLPGFELICPPTDFEMDLSI